LKPSPPRGGNQERPWSRWVIPVASIWAAIISFVNPGPPRRHVQLLAALGLSSLFLLAARFITNRRGSQRQPPLAVAEPCVPQRNQTIRHSLRIAEASLFAILALASGLGAWSLFADSGKLPKNPIAGQYRLDGIGLLVSRPGVHAELALNCSNILLRRQVRWCAVGLAFPPSVKPGTRWALTLASGLALEGHGRVLRGKSTVDGRKILGEVPGERFPVTAGKGASVVASGGQVVTGTVTTVDLRSSWHPVSERAYDGEIPAMDFRKGAVFGIQLPTSPTSSSNGITLGSLPMLGVPPGHYGLSGLPGIQWQPPRGRYLAAVLSPGVENHLLGELATQPATVRSRQLRWSEEQPFHARWSFTQASDLLGVRRDIFFSGALVSLAGAFLVASVQAFVRRRGSETNRPDRLPRTTIKSPQR
jgi:hypothetical protein